MVRAAGSHTRLHVSEGEGGLATGDAEDARGGLGAKGLGVVSTGSHGEVVWGGGSKMPKFVWLTTKISSSKL
jgi:hypothetical protein